MKKFLLLIIIILMASVVYSVAPTTTIFTGDTGINVEVNIMPSYKQGQARFSIIHLFNVSNGVQFTNTTNPNISCHLHLRNGQGFELMEVEATPHRDHWDLNGSGGGSIPIGLYAWTITCQDDLNKVGGYISGYFDITPDGFQEEYKNNLIPLSIIILLICLSMFFVVQFSIQPEDTEEQGNPIRKLFFLLSILFIDITIFVGAFIVGNTLTFHFLYTGLMAIGYAVGMVLFFFLYYVGMGILEDVAIARQKKAMNDDHK